MGFRRDHTFHSRPAKGRRADAKAWEDERLSLLGNAFCAPVVAWLMSHFFAQAQILAAPPLYRDLVAASTCSAPPGHADEGLALARYFLSRRTRRGTELHALLGPTGCRTAARQSLDASFWKWKTIIAARWRRAEHINVLEARAHLALVKWRARSQKQHCSRFLHLTDSAVVMAAMAKGRTSSRRLQGAVRQTAAYTLAAHVQPVIAHVRSHRNPADKPSRQLSASGRPGADHSTAHAPAASQRAPSGKPQATGHAPSTPPQQKAMRQPVTVQAPTTTPLRPQAARPPVRARRTSRRQKVEARRPATQRPSDAWPGLKGAGWQTWWSPTP